ncbi:MAG: hypothetical protein H6R11_914 [Proteobacteria bacterium]|nr:hypothetical protein [Pseudomonadota bacterium]
MASEPRESLLTFPCDFPIKILGRRSDDFAQRMMEIVLRHAPDYDPGAMSMRASSQGAYLSITCIIRAHSREQLDDLYRELSGDPSVVMVL